MVICLQMKNETTFSTNTVFVIPDFLTVPQTSGETVKIQRAYCVPYAQQ